jgi:hypothetical protein
LAGKWRLLPEKGVKPLRALPYLTFGGQEQPEREDNMPGKRTQAKIRTLTGIVLLALGSAVMITYAGAFAWRLAGTLSSPTSLYAGLGMASLNIFQALAFDHSLFFSIAPRMLVLFSAFTMTLIGIALLSRRATGVPVGARHGASALPKGGQ